MLAGLDAELDAESSLLAYFRDINKSQAMRPATEPILVQPNEDRTDAALVMDFETARANPKVLTVVSGQRRNHQVFAEFRVQIADRFGAASGRIREDIGATGATSD